MPGGTIGTPVVVGAEYVTLDEVKEHLAIEDVVVKNDAVIEDRIPVACRAVEDHCVRKFKHIAGNALKVWPNRKGTLYVTDLLASPAPTVYVDTDNNRTFATLVAATEYEFLPFPEDAEELARYQEIAYLSGNYFDQAYPVRVTHDCGWFEDDGRAPHGIRLGILMMFAKWWKRRETPAVVMQMPGFGFKRMIEKDTDIQDILEPYVHQGKKRRPVR